MLPGPGAYASCYDLSKAEPRELTGVLSHVVFAGPPNFEDVQNGDTPEPGYVLTLPMAICLTGDDFADPSLQFSEVQLVATDASAPAMHALVNTNVHVVLSKAIAAETGHHHRPLVAWVTGISSRMTSGPNRGLRVGDRPGSDFCGLKKQQHLGMVLAACLYAAATQSSLAGISSFVAGCIANTDDFSKLGTELPSAGMTEIDPSEGPQFPVPSPERRRLWKSTPAAGVQGDAFTGYVAKKRAIRWWKYAGMSAGREKAERSPCVN